MQRYLHSNFRHIKSSSGQTSSGKTFTMGSSNDTTTQKDDLGIIPRAFNQIFSNLPQETGLRNIIKVSFVEIYQEQVCGTYRLKQTRFEIC
jgi:hypothetical protein